MTLIDLVNDIDTIDEDLIIFQINLNDWKSDITLSSGEDGELFIVDEFGKTFQYLIEVSLANEFIEDWIKTLKHHLSSAEIAERLHYYAVNDA